MSRAIRLPIVPLMKAIRTRILEVLDVPVESLVVQGRARPYVELGDVTWTEGRYKEPLILDVTQDLHVYSNDPNLQSAVDMLSKALEALTATHLELTDGWQATLPQLDGPGRCVKESDSIGIYWHGVARLRWTVEDTS